MGESDQSLLPMETMEVAMPTAAEEAVIDSTTEAIKALNEEASAQADPAGDGDTAVELSAEEEGAAGIEATGEDALAGESVQ